MNGRDWEERERKLDEIKRGKRMPTIAELRELAVRGDGFVDLSGESAEITDSERMALNDELGNSGGIDADQTGKKVAPVGGAAGKKAEGKAGREK